LRQFGVGFGMNSGVLDSGVDAVVGWLLRGDVCCSQQTAVERRRKVVLTVSSWRPAVMTISGVSCPAVSLDEGLLTVRMEPRIVALAWDS
jgi:hypothetical protein